MSAAPSIDDYIRSRNHQLVLLSVGNTHCIGVFTPFALQDYRDGLKQVTTDADNFVFTLAKHKTTHTNGDINNKHEAAIKRQ